MKKQVYNPFLPLSVYIPDGEPHVFGNRLYLSGSHDKEGGDKFCMLDYEIWSAPLDDLTDWTSKGINYAARQDPNYGDTYQYMYAPDIVRGVDGRYYLYYAMSGGCFTGPIHVAVCDTPDGKYEYYGEVRNADGSAFTRKITFDPAVLNDNGAIYLYYGWSLSVDRETLFKVTASDQTRAGLLPIEMELFGKTQEEIEGEPQGIMGAFCVRLDNDMLTVLNEPQRVVAGQFDSLNTEYDGHAFFEGSSIRKIENVYYFIYSSEKMHELCYATSHFPDRDFHFGGTIISNGDIGYRGRIENERLAATGNNHGSIVQVNGQWYVFYHRHTHKTSFSRQACAEKIAIDSKGRIAQTEMTSCGLNDGPLEARGNYPAAICCNLTNGCMQQRDVQHADGDVPFITHHNNDRYVADISDGTTLGYKYFSFTGHTTVTLTERGGEGTLRLGVGETAIKRFVEPSDVWQKIKFEFDLKGVFALYIDYEGAEKIDLLEVAFS